MLDARLRPRLIFPAALVAALVLASTLPRAAVSCPMSMPTPLRRLYVESELVVVARVGDAAVASRDEESSLFRVALHVSKRLKGDAEGRTLPLYHEAWGDEPRLPPWLERGRTLLFFLERRTEGDGYSMRDARLTAARLSDEQLKVYVSRIEELAPILARADHDPAEITEWFVRCAEEPATRWEGAYELAISGDSPQPDAEQQAAKAGEAGDNAHAKDTAAADAARSEEAKAADKLTGGEVAGGEAAPAPDAAESIIERKIVALPLLARRYARREPDFAALLTQSQKERLTASLLSAEELGEGELQLLPVVARWDDARLAPFTLKHLQRMADKPPYEAAELMHLAARTLGDKGLIKLADEYAEGAAYDDLELDEESEAGEDEESRKAAAEMRAAAAEALNWRSTKVYHFLALAQQPQKP